MSTNDCINAQNCNVPKCISYDLREDISNNVDKTSFTQYNVTTCLNSLTLRIQRKLIGKFSSKDIVKHLASESTSTFINDFSRLLLTHYGQEEAEKVIKNALKMSFKIGIISRNNEQASSTEALKNVEQQVRDLSLALSSFQMVNYSYDHAFLTERLLQLQSSVEQVIRGKLSDKSFKRLQFIIDRLSRKEFLDNLFESQCAETKDCLQNFCDRLELLCNSS